jgi:starvation-inducible DNA-binding protein
MMTEIYLDNRELKEYLRLMRAPCERHNDIATAGLIENWVDQSGARGSRQEIAKQV